MAKALTTVKFDYEKFTRQGDFLLAGGVVIILFVMLVPVPPMFIDLMLTLSISVSLVVLVTTMFMTSPLEFSIYPSLLLVTTLLRLSMNVASTRLILLHGDEGTSAAGKVIEAFGQFVVGGNYFVGIVIFLILFALNKKVIVQGTTRIAEVAARFTLDAMPGKQMAIEADLNAGLIKEDEANARRDAIRKEADFYGAMDGAGKFVQGDVTATLIITAINIVGGFCIGVFQKGMNWADAAQTYTILTIGDGLVSIIPSIIISTSAGLIVSRAASEAKMGEEFIAQLTYHPRALRLVSGILCVFGIVPGMPTLPFLSLAALIYGVSVASARQRELLSGKEKDTQGKAKKKELETPEEVQSLLPLDILELEVGYGLIPLVDEEQSGNLLARIRSIRRQFALDMGLVIPSLHLRDNLQIKPGQYVVLIKGNEVASAEILIDHYLAMDPGDAKHRIRGVETREPAFNLPALWIPATKKEDAMLAGYTVVDPATVIATHLTEVFRRHLHEFLSRQETQNLLDNLAKRAPKAVEELVPGMLTLGAVQKVLQNLIRENVSIRDLLTIVETLSDYGHAIKDPDQLTEYVRSRMGRTIVKPYLSPGGNLPIFNLAPKVEGIIQESLRKTDHGTYLAMEPAMAQKIIQSIKKAMDKALSAEGQPVLLASPMSRPHLSQLLMRFVPNLPVVSQAEIPGEIKLQSLATIGINNAG
ncbi:flagellar biosynthesis protein FlhA [Desulfolutivibrio sulfoxidireducens]|uniref:flagellar biosynthesis protein FlhA n=1 Tax=Desulfolutivibrio sulfoxidireducens TaxID=2773299 RepID=UPI00159E5E79|nr:flagellar biosynthesis protein FlhA [Desulfolutivibrio sulfoxidireducens]QLA16411.1 flagellar biosynthesis protein FlhA [Desulfolutivibrio sulfoxidireducens]QLA19708.1 flagellar biosynthesis protein FlhA [Desulfolutivibrio sulfoxidireducens]